MSKVESKQISKCYHCGEDCVDSTIYFDKKEFCCEGCKTVYDLLSENNLCEYYDLNSKPGTSLKTGARQNKFDYLDDPQVQQQIIRFSDGGISTCVFYVPQIHCSSCIYLLENLYRLKDGILRSNVNFQKRDVAITFDNKKVSLRDVVETMSLIGYEPKISLDDLEHKEKSSHLSRYYLKIGIAFFAFGNMMLLSFPEYFGVSALAESSYRQFFGYLNFALALPVTFYCASEFFISAWNGIRHKVSNMDIPIALGIAVMFLRSSYEIFFTGGAGYFDTLGSLVLLMLIGRLFQNKSYDSMSFERDYKSYFPVSVTIITDELEKNIPLSKLKVGETTLIRNEELIPADSVLLSKEADIDYSFVTGESRPVHKVKGDSIFAGGKLVGASANFIITKEVSHSYLTQLWNDETFDKDSDKTITTLATKVSRYFTPTVILISIVAFAYWSNADMNKAINAFTSMLIITCPCALALSSPFTFGNVIRILGRNKIYLKGAVVVEKIANISAIVFDKTGTITDTKKSFVAYTGKALSKYEHGLIKSLVRHSSHPLSKKVYNYLPETIIIHTKDFREVMGKGIEGWIDEVHVKVGSASFIGIENHSKGDLASVVHVSFNKEYLGYFSVRNVYRSGFESVITAVRNKFNVFILSGDNASERGFLSKHIDEHQLVFDQSPTDKLNFIKRKQSEGISVMMIGDGLNDAGALKQADVGISISDDVNNFSPACDAIIDASEFNNIPKLIDFTLKAKNIVFISFGISIAYNLVGTYFAVQGTMSPLVAAILMPISSVTILLFTTLSTIFIGRRIGLK
jgi:P-type Cu+ transporter